MSTRVSNGWKKWVRWVPVVGICSLTLTASAQWNTNAWARDPAFRNTNAMWATIHSFTVTNETSPGVFVVTNDVWRSNITFTNFTTNAMNSTFTIRSLRWTNGVPTNFTYSVSDSKTLTRTNLVQTWQDQIQLDCALAVDERVLALPYYQSDTFLSRRSVRFYHSPQQNLLYLKENLQWMMDPLSYALDWLTFYVSEPVFSNMMAAGTLAYTNVSSAIWRSSDYNFINGQMTSNNDIRIAADVPSNYFAATFYRDLFYTNSYFLNVMTCSVYFGGTFGGTTNLTFTDCCGVTGRVVSGTNGQVVSFVCTNTSISPGRTAADYNFYAIRRIVTNLTAMLHVPMYSTAEAGPPYGYQSSYTGKRYSAAATSSNIADAINGAFSAWSSSPASEQNIYIGHAYTRAGGFYSAEVHTWTFQWSFWMWQTPFDQTVEWYFSGRTPTNDFLIPPAEVWTFSDMGSGLSNSDSLVLFSVTNIAGNAETNIAFQMTTAAAVTNWAAYHRNGSVRGIAFNYPVWLGRPKPTTNGFRYR